MDCDAKVRQSRVKQGIINGNVHKVLCRRFRDKVEIGGGKRRSRRSRTITNIIVGNLIEYGVADYHYVAGQHAGHHHSALLILTFI